MSFYSIVSLTGQSRNFLEALRAGSADKNMLIAAAVARAIVDRLHMPSSPVESCVEHYEQQCRDVVKSLVGQITEITLIDTKLTQQYTRDIWNLRYRVLHPFDKLFLNPDLPFESYLGFNTSIASDFVKCISDNAETAVLFTNGFTDLINEICPVVKPEETNKDTPVEGNSGVAVLV